MGTNFSAMYGNIVYMTITMLGRFMSGGEKVNMAGKYEYWLSQEGQVLLQGWARDGLTDEQIAKNMCISPSTLYEWKKKYSEISESLKEGKEIADYLVENALFKNALEGNTTAQIFWLKNRKRDKWRDNPEPEMEEEKEEGIVIELTRNGEKI